MSSKPSAPPLSSFLETFISRGKINEESSTYIPQINDLLSSELASVPEAIEFLKLQADMISLREEFTVINIVDKIPEKTVAAYYNPETKAITIAAVPNKRLLLSQTISHEMVHAMDDVIGLGTEKKIASLLESADHSSTMQTRDFLSQILPKDIAIAYRLHANDTGLVIQETASYISEGIFSDIFNHRDPADISQRFNSITPTGRRDHEEKRIAQEIAAIAIHDIAGAMLEHISTIDSPSPAIRSINDRLAAINEQILPHYEAAMKRIADKGIVAGVAESVSMGGAGGSSSASTSTARKREVDIMEGAPTETSRKLLHVAFTDRMRASFKKINNFYEQGSLPRKITKKPNDLGL